MSCNNNNNSNNSCSSSIKLQVEVYGLFKFRTIVDSDLEIRSLYSRLEEEIKVNYNVHFQIVNIKDYKHTDINVDMKIKDRLKSFDSIYLYVTIPEYQLQKKKQLELEKQQQIELEQQLQLQQQLQQQQLKQQQEQQMEIAEEKVKPSLHFQLHLQDHSMVDVNDFENSIHHHHSSSSQSNVDHDQYLDPFMIIDHSLDNSQRDIYMDQSIVF